MKYLFMLLIFSQTLLFSKEFKGSKTMSSSWLFTKDSFCVELPKSRVLQKICIKEVTLKYKVSTLLNEPTVSSSISWQIDPTVKLKNSKKLTYSQMSPAVKKAFNALTIMDPTKFLAGYGIYNYVIYDGGVIGRSGAKDSFNPTGSPNWNRLFLKDIIGFKDMCRKLNKNALKDDAFLTEKNAKDLMKHRTYIVNNIEICNLTFTGTHELDWALKEDCSWREGDDKQSCICKKASNSTRKECEKKDKEKMKEMENLLDEVAPESVEENDMFDDTPYAQNSADDMFSDDSSAAKPNLFDDIQDEIDSQNKAKENSDFQKRTKHLQQNKDAQISACKRNRPTKPKEKFLCNTHVERPIEIRLTQISYKPHDMSQSEWDRRNYVSPSQRRENQRRQEQREKEEEEKYAAEERVLVRECNRKKQIWLNDKSNYPIELNQWQKNRDSCIQQAENQYRNSIKSFKESESEIDDMLSDY